MLRSFRRLVGDESGAVLLEMTFLIPVLLTLAFGAIEFGAVFFTHQTITQQVREASRYLARTTTPTSTVTAFQFATSKYPERSDELCEPSTPGNCILPWLTASNMSAAVTLIDNPEDENGFRLYRGGPTVPVVTVTAIVTYPGLGLLRAIGLNQPIQLTRVHSERVIGH
jgi:Flp pilus assembly protein TadG